MGYKINAQGISPKEDKVAAIKVAPEPQCKAELQSFLGMINFYNRFLKDKATEAEPLFRLLEKNTRWKWTEQHRRAFKRMKELLQADTVLTHYRPDVPLILSCDVSLY